MRVLLFHLVLSFPVVVVAQTLSVNQLAAQISQHNQDFDKKHVTWRAKLHEQFKNLTASQLRTQLLGTPTPSMGQTPRMPTPAQSDLSRAKRQVQVGLPDSFDAGQYWDHCNSTIYQVRDQGSCASSWVQAAVAAMTDRRCILFAYATFPQLSAQHPLSCMPSFLSSQYSVYTSNLCQASLPTQAVLKMHALYGIVTGGEYNQPAVGCMPYNNLAYRRGLANTNSCPTSCPDTNYSVTMANDLSYGSNIVLMGNVFNKWWGQSGAWSNHSYNVNPFVNEYKAPAYSFQYGSLSDVETLMKTEIYINGPVVATMDVYYDFYFYSSGVYQMSPGSVYEGQLSVKIIGWGEDGNGIPYWNCINSWGTSWGNQGFFQILRGSNHVNIENYVNAAIAANSPATSTPIQVITTSTTTTTTSTTTTTASTSTPTMPTTNPATVPPGCDSFSSLGSWLSLPSVSPSAAAANAAFVIKHNANSNRTWTAKFNGGLIYSLGAQLPTFVPSMFQPAPQHQPVTQASRPLPAQNIDNFDVRGQWTMCNHTFNDIRSQGNCGSCWANAAASVISDRICIESLNTINKKISVQHQLSCMPSFLTNGQTNLCDGFYPYRAMVMYATIGLVTGGEYGQSTVGCMPLSRQAYSNDSASTNCCPASCTDATYSLTLQSDLNYGQSVVVMGYNIQSCNNNDSYFCYNHTYAMFETLIKTEVFNNGPVVATFQVFNDFFSYGPGVYIQTPGSSSAGWHAVKLIGWGVLNGIPYWLCVNSWGSAWGDGGFFKILRGSNHCSIEGFLSSATPATAASVQQKTTRAPIQAPVPQAPSVGQTSVGSSPGLCVPQVSPMFWSNATSWPLNNSAVTEPQGLTVSYVNTSFASVQDYIVRKHNCLRSLPLPPASNMLQMQWNSEAAAKAQAWAKTCSSGYDDFTNRRTSQFDCGQNVQVTSNLSSWNTILNTWYATGQSFIYNSSANILSKVAPYTQLTWGTSFQVGCGYQNCSSATASKYVYVCNYCPAGNIQRLRPYLSGAPCGSCPASCVSGKLCSNPCQYTNSLISISVFGHAINCDTLNATNNLCSPSSSHYSTEPECKATCTCASNFIYFRDY